MSRVPGAFSLTALARIGFTELSSADAGLSELETLLGMPRAGWQTVASIAADPDAALASLVRIARRSPEAVRAALASEEAAPAVWALLGASSGFGDFFLRHPDELVTFVEAPRSLPTRAEMTTEMLVAVDAHGGFAARGDESAWVALRVRYRALLARIAGFDLRSSAPVEIVGDVAASISDAAGAALEASLAVARTRLCGGPGAQFTRAEVAAARLAIIGMGKAGARELNYVSDVDVIFVGGARAGAGEAGEPGEPEGSLSEPRAIELTTRLALQTMRGVSAPEVEPPLWEVDANLRPEGKKGALVRTLDSHIAYYERWANSWEFQALLKARPLAGDAELGDQYVAAVGPMVWASSARENFVDSVQRMRERVTEHIPAEEAPLQIKLGAGGLRDIEFTVQLLQLVHGFSDDAIRQRGTLDALHALVDEGYIGRADAATFAHDYRVLRLLEHRMQLLRLKQTHLMPRTPEGLRVLARGSGLADNGAGIWELWEGVKREVREIHVRLFYRPLLSAVAALPDREQELSPEQAADRLAAIGFVDPHGALRHIGALTAGLSRKATIQRHLMPVMIGWFAEGADPDYGLLAFRRISEKLGDTHWFLRMLRDSSAAAHSMTRLLTGSRYVGELMEWTPESAAWLDSSEQLRPRGAAALREEAEAILARREDEAHAVKAIRALRRREMLRAAMGTMLGVLSRQETSETLTDITDVTLQTLLRIVRREIVPPEDDALEFAIIGMGRFGGAELGFGSDADIMFVYRARGVDPERAHKLALALVAELRARSDDHRMPLELDADLRPEGRNGPMARSFDAYAEYYRRWSHGWESQALLRARGVAGEAGLQADFMALVDEMRYPPAIEPQAVREIKRIKARVESERLPQGAPPERHLKLGPGSLSDVEWLVQLLQLQHAAALPQLRTASTIEALDAAAAAGLVTPLQADRLAEAWTLASRLRSANTLWSGRASDLLPTDRRQLDGIARMLGYAPGSATELEEHYMAVTRRARRIFEKLFYGETSARAK
ncbi:MAG: bifunctional [glutamine synthetase] adenylyltransferase/[glutamine synthetase]-adenylyl-L-tyrosine phosphorylase [Microbacteriaceae bacterium]|nr:bifunctional [glutamine synthetase] adenylyltransferase/[glutamine synthetase]-adenylyl-L-tyrosine phosphorylase [Microbacteriaceae bacterium]